MTIIVIATIAGLILGFILSYFIGTKTAQVKIKEAEEQSKNLIANAEDKAKSMHKEKMLEIKEEISQKKIEF